MFFIVGYQMLDVPLTNTPIAAGGVSVAAYIMVSMAMYGAMMSATQTGASVAVERAQGWTRQLRLTPLNPAVNVAVKTVAGMMFGLVAIAATFAAGAATGVVLSPAQWIVSGLASWLLAGAVFTLLGLMVGYMVPGENVAQITSLVVVLMSFLGGLFFPLSSMPDFLQTIAQLTPVYGIGELARGPLTGDPFDLGALVNAVVWLLVFAVGTVYFFRRDTRRG
jgi:ABC-2 type transport system permease protein